METLGTVAGIPTRGPLTLGVNDEQDATTFASEAQAAQRSGGKQLTSQPLACDAAISRETGEFEAGNLVACQSLRHSHGHGFMSYCRRRDCIKAENPVCGRVVDRTEGLGGILFVALSREPPQEIVHLRITAIERSPIVLFRNRLLVP